MSNNEKECLCIYECLSMAEEQLKGLETKDAQRYIYNLMGMVADLVKRDPKSSSGQVCPRDFHYVQKMLDGCEDYIKQEAASVTE